MALGAAALLVIEACSPNALQQRQPLDQAPPAEPPWLRQPLAGSAATAPPEPVTALSGSVADPDAGHFDPQAIATILDDPLLSAARAAHQRGAPKEAADTLAAVLAQTPPAPEQEPAWWYQLGRLRELAGDPNAAVRAYDRAAVADWPLQDHALARAGDLLERLGQSEAALVRLMAISNESSAIHGEVARAKARALATTRDDDGKRRLDEAGAIWDAYLAQQPRPRGWQVVALRYAKALLHAPSVPHAKRAVRIARLVIYESPRGRGVGEARELEQQALSTIPSPQRKPFKEPALDERMLRARSLGEASQGREAIAAAKALLRALKREHGVERNWPAELACEAYIARGRGLDALRRRSEASGAFGNAIRHCAGSERQVYALFLGGRTALRSGQDALARRRYAQLEKNFPKHRFADDARLHGAEAALDLGDVAAFNTMLRNIDEAYPEGDMVDQALFALARARIEIGDWAGAMRPLERAVAHQTRGRPYYAEGRPHYYLARAHAELGMSEQAKREFARVIRQFPLSYYMVLAYSRLADIDPMAAKRALELAISTEPDGAFVIPDHPELHRPGFLRAVELVRQGDGRRALAELEALGVREKNAHPALLWASAFLLSRIDAPAESHSVLRSSTQLWTEHYPAGVWRPLWEVAYPRPYQAIVTKELKRSVIPEELAYAIMREESAFKPRVVSHANAYGLMQLIEPTAKAVARGLRLTATPASLKRPEINIALGCRFLSQLTRRFDYNPLLAIPGYNAGPGAPMKWVDRRPADDFDLWVERIPYRETRRYTKRVIRSMAAYSMLYGHGMAGSMMRIPSKVQPRERLEAGDG